MSGFTTPSADIIEKLRSDIENARTESLKQQALAFCQCLSERLSARETTIPLPAFYTTWDDDEFYLEWISDGLRAGFDFYDDEAHSGWFVLVMENGRMERHGSDFNRDYLGAVNFVLSVIDGRSQPGAPECRSSPASDCGTIIEKSTCNTDS